MITLSFYFQTQEDEESFEMFSTYCGLALYYASLYEKIHRSEQKYLVASEMLSYYNTSSDEEVNALVSEGLPQADHSLQR